MRLRRLAVPAAVALATVLATSAALAHADLVSSTPAPDAELPTAPDEVTLVFGGELSPDGTILRVTDADGAVVGEDALDLAVADRNEVRGSVEIALPGTYTVAWTAVAIDGLVAAGDFVFTVAAGSGSPDTATRPADRHVPSALGWILLLFAMTIGLRRAVRAPS